MIRAEHALKAPLHFVSFLLKHLGEQHEAVCLFVVVLGYQPLETDTVTVRFSRSRGDVRRFKIAKNNFDSRSSLMIFPSLFGNLLGKTAIKVIHVSR